MTKQGQSLHADKQLAKTDIAGHARHRSGPPIRATSRGRDRARRRTDHSFPPFRARAADRAIEER
jgi:hypothetical protein